MGQPEATGAVLSGPACDEQDVEAHVEAALARILVAGSDPPPAVAELQGEDQSQERRQQIEGTGSEEDDGLAITGTREEHKVKREETTVVDRARPKTAEVETCRH